MHRARQHVHEHTLVLCAAALKKASQSTEHNGINVAHREWGHTPAHVAAERAHLSLFKWLVLASSGLSATCSYYFVLDIQSVRIM